MFHYWHRQTLDWGGILLDQNNEYSVKSARDRSKLHRGELFVYYEHHFSELTGMKKDRLRTILRRVKLSHQDDEDDSLSVTHAWRFPLVRSRAEAGKKIHARHIRPSDYTWCLRKGLVGRMNLHFLIQGSFNCQQQEISLNYSQASRFSIWLLIEYKQKSEAWLISSMVFFTESVL